MREWAMREFRMFLVAVVKHWLASMGGGLFACLTMAASLWSPQWLAWLFGLLCFAFVISACFLAWRDQYREAHSYDEETFAFVKAQFMLLNEEEKTSLARLAIAKRLPSDQMPATLESTGFLQRDFTTGHVGIAADFSRILPQLVKEWEAGISN